MKKVLTLAQVPNEHFWPKAALSKSNTKSASHHAPDAMFVPEGIQLKTQLEGVRSTLQSVEVDE